MSIGETVSARDVDPPAPADDERSPTRRLVREIGSYKQYLGYVTAAVLALGSTVAVLNGPLVAWINLQFQRLPAEFRVVLLLLLTVAMSLAIALAVLTRLQKRELDQEVNLLREDRDRLLAEKDALLRFDGSVWGRPDTGGHNSFVAWRERTGRRTRFVSFFSIKGGTGKTTLSANIAACLAAERRDLRILMVDLDQQGSLGLACLSAEERDAKLPATQSDRHGYTSVRLLDSPSPDEHLFNNLPAAVAGRNDLFVVTATTRLEQVNRIAEARFIIDGHADCRFRFQEVFHREHVFHDYDLVVFDCPPRLTAASVNALVASDYVFVPTQLDEKAFDTARNTLNWIGQLHKASEVRVAGVMVNQAAVRSDKLIRVQQENFDMLRSSLRAYAKEHPGTSPDLLFDQPSTWVRQNNNIGSAGQSPEGRLPALDKQVRPLFAGAAAEFARRINL